MSDVDDLVEAIVDIEDIAEEVFEPDELLEDLVENTVVIAVALIATFAAVMTLLLFVLAVVLFFVAPAFVLFATVFAVFGLVVTILTIVAFLYVRTDIPDHVRRKIESAEEQASDDSRESASMTEEEAVEALKSRYANGELSDRELEESLDEVLTSDQPENVVERYE
jgi:uncharacterized membrane protein